MSLLQIKNVNKSYQKEVLNDVTFDVFEDEIVSIIGKSGSGKTTLFHAISQLETIDSGEILLRNRPIQLGEIAYMQQKDLLLPFYTILENCMLPLKIKKDLNALKKASQLLNELGLDNLAYCYPHELSGGQKQRVAFARTLLTGKKLILLDEPFSALDAITKKTLQKWYLEQSKKYQLTTLLITHDIDEALMFSNRILILSQGKIIKVIENNKENNNLKAEIYRFLN